ncbi:TrbC/VirB2 family protein [Burkholderia cepacia]|uniref:TrbC/VirB2 family protein n=1 Tax=Burkholderia cepacia TaxID=292 RepID=UPI002AB68E0C|nr:TrbC/VirB2 family protein [Burkholderia cepacia]
MQLALSNSFAGFSLKALDRKATITLVVIAALMFAAAAIAGTAGTEWQPLYQKVLDMLQGYGGKFIAIAAFGWGLFSIFGRGSLATAMVAFGIAIAVFIVPTLLDSFFTAVI